MGMSPREAQVMDLFDGGSKREEIARELGLSLDRVNSIVGTYPVDTSEVRRERQAMQHADAAFVAALQREGFA